MYALYRNITGLSEPVLNFLLRSRIKKNKEDPQRYIEKKGRYKTPRPEGHLIWIHGASIGEAQSALIMLHRLREIYPSAKFLMTTGTLTSATLMQRKLPEGCIHQYYPLDHPDYVERFLTHWKPDLVLWMESEIWPNMLDGLKKRSIPAVLVNARMSEKSYRTWRVFPSIIKHALDAFDKILCQSEQDYENYANLGADNAYDIGNIKYAASPLICNKEDLSLLQKQTTDRVIWLFASTHADEEAIAADIHSKLKKSIPELLTIIVPRHPERRDKILETLARFTSLKTQLRSTQAEKAPDKNTDIYIADTLGELGLFYRLSPISCIGRSFSSDGGGGHNPLEAAQLGSVVLHGPKVQNLKEIYDDMAIHNVAILTQTPQDLQAQLANLFHDKALRERYQNDAVKYSRSKMGVIDSVLNHITPYLDQAGVAKVRYPMQEKQDAI